MRADGTVLFRGTADDEIALGVLAPAFARQTPTFLGIFDAQLTLRFLNAAARNTVGLPLDADISTHHILDFFTPKHRLLMERVGLPELMRTGCWEADLSLRHRRDPSREIEVRWSSFALHDASGQPIGAAASASTLQSSGRCALCDQQTLLASVLDILPLGIGVSARDGVLLDSSRRLRDHVRFARHPQSALRRLRSPSQEQDAAVDRAPSGEAVMPAPDLLLDRSGASERWMRISAVPFDPEGEANGGAIVVQGVVDFKRATERREATGAELASQSRFLEATLSSIPDYVYAFDPQRRFAYANPAMLELFGLQAEEMLGKTFADLGYPQDLADHLDAHLKEVLTDGATVGDEVFFQSPTGYAAYFSYLWGPVRAEDGSIELVVGVSRDTSERRAVEEQLTKSEARLRAATELVGLGIYSWNLDTGALEWDDRLRAMWGLPAGTPVDMHVYENGIHPDDLARVQSATTACIDADEEGQYKIEYRVIGRDGVLRHVATSGRTVFDHGRAIGFIGVATDITNQRRAEAALREREAQFRSFAEHSSNLIWIGDPAAGEIIYRSAAFERIWGIPCQEESTRISEWMEDVHPEDRVRVGRALEVLSAGEVAHFEYRIIRPRDGSIRWLKDIGFPILDENGAVVRIGGITEDLTRDQDRQVYIVSDNVGQARSLASLARSAGHRTRIFDSASAFLDLAPVLAPGCVLVDLRKARQEGLSIPRELKARSIALPTIVLDEPASSISSAVAAMKAGAVDYLTMSDDAAFRAALMHAIIECHGFVQPTSRDETAGALIARLTPREREVLVGLVDGGTNKTIAQDLGISPRTVELHRAQVMSRLSATSLTQLLQIALAAGVSPTDNAKHRRTTKS